MLWQVWWQWLEVAASALTCAANGDDSGRRPSLPRLASPRSPLADKGAL